MSNHNDLPEFQVAQEIKSSPVTELTLALQSLQNDLVDDGVRVMILLRCMGYKGVIVQNEVQKYFNVKDGPSYEMILDHYHLCLGLL